MLEDKENLIIEIKHQLRLIINQAEHIQRMYNYDYDFDTLKDEQELLGMIHALKTKDCVVQFTEAIKERVNDHAIPADALQGGINLPPNKEGLQ